MTDRICDECGLEEGYKHVIDGSGVYLCVVCSDDPKAVEVCRQREIQARVAEAYASRPPADELFASAGDL